jgi:protein-L-isoaspartate O-methyltransferase
MDKFCTISYYQKTRSEVLEYVTSTPRSVLEIGCGAGMFGALLKEKFACRVIGVELEKEVARIAKSKLDKVYTERIETLIESGKLCKDFDLIVLNDVIDRE